MKVKKYFKCILLFMLLSFVGCSQHPRTVQQMPVDLVWPASPDIPRIKWLESFASPEEFGQRTSFFKKISQFITGKEDVKRALISPYNLCVDERENIYVTDTYSQSIHIFDRKSGKYHEISTTKDGEFRSPIGIAVDSQERIYVSDSILKKIYVFSRDRKQLYVIGSEDFSRPTGIAVDSDLERLYVVDTLEHCIKWFDFKGKLIKSIGTRGKRREEFNFPTNICVDSKHRIYVCDSLNFRIQVLNSKGNFISSFGQVGDGTGFFARIKGIAVDGESNIYVTDAQFDVVQIFNLQGDYLLSFGNSGQYYGEFSFPAGIFIDKHDKIYIVDRLNQRVQIFKYLKNKDEKK